MTMEISGPFGTPVFDMVAHGRTVSGDAQGRVTPDVPFERPTRDEIDQMVAQLQTTAAVINRRLRFSVNTDIGGVIVKVIDANTDKVIKELPPEALQRIQSRLSEAIGLLLDERV
ncbi:MAG: flagellar protein FlaG [Spirochaetota bacterium]